MGVSIVGIHHKIGRTRSRMDNISVQMHCALSKQLSNFILKFSLRYVSSMVCHTSHTPFMDRINNTVYVFYNSLEPIIFAFNNQVLTGI